MHDPSPQACLEKRLERRLEQAALGRRPAQGQSLPAAAASAL